MAGMLRKGMSWLGLGSEDDYEPYEVYDESEDAVVDLTAPRAGAYGGPAVRTVDFPADVPEEADDHGTGVRVLPGGRSERVERPVRAVPTQPSDAIRPRSVVRQVPATPSTKPHVVSPKSFNDAQEVGDWFKKRQPVIVNLQGLDRDLTRRLLDFASGVAYGLGGNVERVASHVYLLTPADVEVSDDDRRRLRERGLVDERS